MEKRADELTSLCDWLMNTKQQLEEVSKLASDKPALLDPKGRSIVSAITAEPHEALSSTKRGAVSRVRSRT